MQLVQPSLAEFPCGRAGRQGILGMTRASPHPRPRRGHHSGPGMPGPRRRHRGGVTRLAPFTRTTLPNEGQGRTFVVLDGILGHNRRLVARFNPSTPPDRRDPPDLHVGRIPPSSAWSAPRTRVHASASLPLPRLADRAARRRSFSDFTGKGTREALRASSGRSMPGTGMGKVPTLLEDSGGNEFKSAGEGRSRGWPIDRREGSHR